MIYLTLFLISILLMMLLIFLLIVRIAGMKYSLYKCFIRKIFWNDSSCWNWLRNNVVFVWYHVLVVALVGIALVQLGQLMKVEIFERPLMLSLFSPVFYLSLTFIFLYHTRELEEKEI